MKPPDISISTNLLKTRLATEEDAGDVSRLNRLFNGVEATAAQIAIWMAASAQVERVIVAEVNGRIIGLACLRLVPTPLYAKPYAELTELFVEAAYRRQGVGTTLMRHAETLARQGGAEELLLQTDDLNHNARSFYQSIGYADYGVMLHHPL